VGCLTFILTVIVVYCPGTRIPVAAVEVLDAVIKNAGGTGEKGVIG